MTGSIQIDLDFAILEFDANGKVMQKSMNKVSGTMTQKQIEHLSAKTLSTTQTIKLNSGATTIVVGVRDDVSERFGTVKVSLSNH